MKIFIVDWSIENKTELISAIEKSGHEIAFELHDGADAYRKIGIWKPHMILINYAVKPSHGKITAESIKQRKSTADIPIYFIDGKASDNEKIIHLGTPISNKELTNIL